MKRVLFGFWILCFCHVTQAQIITTFAGCGTMCTGLGDGGPATVAVVNDPIGGVFDSYGNYYYAEGLGKRVRKVNITNIITTVAGNGTGGSPGDGGSATAAHLNTPSGVRLDALGNIYISDNTDSRIRKVDVTTGIISTIAGNGTGGFFGEGIPATASQIWGPQDICFDKFGNLYIADQVNIKVRKVTTSGIISTFAGSGGFSSTGTGDNGPATSATFNLIMGLAADDTGNIYIADYNAGKVRKVNTSGIISTIAGNGVPTYIGDGMLATNAQIAPLKLGINSFGNLVVADKYNRRVLIVDKFGIIHSIAGNGATGYSGDGVVATAASIDYPGGVSFDACGNLYVTDINNRRVRKVALGTNITPIISLSGTTSYPIGASVTVTATVSNACSSYIIHWMNKGVEFAATTTPSVTYTKAMATDSITARVVPQCGGCYDSTTSSFYVVTSAPSLVNSYASLAVNIYPNPAHNELTVISNNKISSVTISNFIGQVVQTNEYVSEKAVVNMANLPAGVYVVKVTDSEGGKTVARVVKE